MANEGKNETANGYARNWTEEKEEIGRLYEEYASLIFNFLVYFTGERQAAEDLLQETFLRLVKSHGRFAGRSSRRTWILQVAKNTAVDWARKRRLLSVDASFDLDLLPAGEEGTEKEALDRERQRDVHQAIRELRPNYRIVVILRALEGLTVAETAEALAWSEGKVKTTYHRALRQLAQVLEAKGVGPDVTFG